MSQDEPNTFEISRRKALAALGTIGAASAGAGLGTSAWFSDQEEFSGNQLVAGDLDLKVSWTEHYYDGSPAAAQYVHRPGSGEEPDLALPGPENGYPIEFVFDDREQFMDATLREQFPEGGLGDEQNPCGLLANVPEDLEAPVIALEDVKPGDFGEVTFDLASCSNPAYLWLTGELLENAENGLTEPERSDPDEDDTPTDVLLDNGIYEVTVGEYDSGSAGGAEANGGASDDDWFYSFSGTAGGNVDPAADDSIDTLYLEYYALQDGEGNVAPSSDGGPVITSLPASGSPGTEYTGIVEMDLGGTTVRVHRTVSLRADEPVVDVDYEFENRSGSETITDLQWTQYVDYDIGSPSGEVGNYVRDDDRGLEYITQNEQNVIGDNDLYLGFTAEQLSTAHDLDNYSSTDNKVYTGATLNDDDQFPDTGGADVGLALRYDLGTLGPGESTTLETAFVTAESLEEFESRLQEAGPNNPPVADAGPNQTVDEGASVDLDGTGSSDADGDDLTYSWSQTGGPTVTLSDTSSSTPSFTAPDVTEPTTLTFELTVEDGRGGSDTDTVSVAVQSEAAENSPPVADAGASQTVEEGTTVQLDGSGSSDPDGDALRYAWSQTGGPTVSLSGSTSEMPTFTAPPVDEPATLTFALTVDDDRGETDTDTTTVTVEPEETIITGDGELAEALQVRVWYDDGDNIRDEGEQVFCKGSLATVLEKMNSGHGIPLDGDGSTETDFDESGDPTSEDRDPFPGAPAVHYLGFQWWLPLDHANEVQTDSVEFDLGFYAEQARHNDGAGLGPADGNGTSE
ncbi:hypothetical protein HTSR_0904 [Halodesulfurarchaeum formicicum]|uniref:PKD/Chitinase domain-containing protein n=1 Tax=Halodesulfurarchaeum formicicum TaxID=1873524 RepID=A0A1D8S404_9EURY|nr:PKD domain-containing protein [Halodesulfurarchaeum formicicum]AOW80089.1 hypothetical protein HTSR_0904 [Halodesulfurarchaeum formicicum]